jgi:nucleotide-binding universal stress UspA family protein
MVGVDGSRSHLSIVDLAVAAAVRHRTSLLIVHVWPGRYSGALRPRGPIPTEADGRHLLEIAQRRAEHLSPALHVGTKLVHGSASAVLTGISGEARLLVAGHRDDASHRPSWGPTAAYLAHHSACPLLIYRGGAPDRGPVVLAASARPTGTATVACAFEEAALAGARLVAVHTWSSEQATLPRRMADRATGRAEADRLLAESLTGWSRRYPEVEVERLLLEDTDIAYTIQRASHRGRLLVAGIGRMGRSAELLYGTAESALSSQAACPVLLVPPAWRSPTGTRLHPDTTASVSDQR